MGSHNANCCTAILFNSWSVCVGRFPYSASGSFHGWPRPWTSYYYYYSLRTPHLCLICYVDRTRQNCNSSLVPPFPGLMDPTNSQNQDTRPLYYLPFCIINPLLLGNPICWFGIKGKCYVRIQSLAFIYHHHWINEHDVIILVLIHTVNPA